MDNTTQVRSVSIEDIADYVGNSSMTDDVVVFEKCELRNDDEGISFPMRLDALMIALCTGGEGKIGIDLNEYKIGKNDLLVLNPRNYIHHISREADTSAMILVCSHTAIEEILPKLTDLAPSLINANTTPVIALSDEQSDRLKAYYELIMKCLDGERTSLFKRRVQCLLQAIFYEVLDMRFGYENNTLTKRSRREEIMAKFILAVSENFRVERQVSFYADKLCITPKHLSAVVKDLTGKTAGDWIENYVVLEAKVLLKSTDMTIQEIATQLNFNNQSFFGKYFKHLTGLSPTEYRHRNS